VKQYSTDVAVVLGLLLLALRIRERGLSARQAWGAAAAGLIAAWFSQGAVLALVGIAAVLLWQAWRAPAGGRAALRALVPVVAVWLLSGMAATAAGMTKMNPAMRDYLHRFWAPGFMPLPPWQRA